MNDILTIPELGGEVRAQGSILFKFQIISTLAGQKQNNRKQTLTYLNAHRIMGRKHDGNSNYKEAPAGQLTRKLLSSHLLIGRVHFVSPFQSYN